ncbi:MAG: LCP family protein [Clostridiaceae bacterium]|nr:LCP family protein [Clostridiaceae bacterium]
MNFRRTIFLVCTVFSIGLFSGGVLILSQHKEESKSDLEIRNNPVKIINRNTDNSDEIISNVNFLVLGLDEEETRSDVITLINYKPKTGKMKILSLARDTRVKLNGKYMKLNALYGNGGEKLIIEKVEEITGLEIDYYMTLNFKGFREIVDTLGGVEINVPFNMNYDDPEQNLHIHLKKGKQTLNGEKAEQFVRYRKGNLKGQGYKDGDIGRIKTQQQFIHEFVKQKLKMKYLLKADDIFYILKDNMKTNVEMGNIGNFAKIVRGINTEQIQSYTLPGYSSSIDNQWYYIYDRKKTRELINNEFL